VLCSVCLTGGAGSRKGQVDMACECIGEGGVSRSCSVWGGRMEMKGLRSMLMAREQRWTVWSA
jgi:hypothetical protein